MTCACVCVCVCVWLCVCVCARIWDQHLKVRKTPCALLLVVNMVTHKLSSTDAALPGTDEFISWDAACLLRLGDNSIQGNISTQQI